MKMITEMSETEQLFALVERASLDDAYIDGLKAKLIENGLWEAMGCVVPLVKKQTPPPGAPRTENITAVRAGLWDNWPMGTRVKNHPNRFGLSLDIWDCAADDIEAVKVNSMNCAFRSNLSLMGRASLQAQVRSLRKPRANALSNVDGSYLDMLLDLSSDHPKAMFGMMNTNIKRDDGEFYRGVYYHPMQFVMARFADDGAFHVTLCSGDEPLPLSPFVKADVNGEQLKGIVSQSRTDRCGFDSSWDSRS